jgi:hypothetical protein
MDIPLSPTAGVVVMGAPNPASPFGVSSSFLSELSSFLAPNPSNPANPTFFSSVFSSLSGAGVVLGVNPENPAKSFLIGAGVVSVESPETEVAAVELPVVPPPPNANGFRPNPPAASFASVAGAGVVAGVILLNPANPLGAVVLMEVEAGLNPKAPATEVFVVLSDGFGVVLTLAGADANAPNPSPLFSKGLSAVPVDVDGVANGDDFVTAPNPPKVGFSAGFSVGLSVDVFCVDCPNPKVGFESGALSVVVCSVADCPNPLSVGLASAGLPAVVVVC